eukprot:TRINITY_DN5456_c0_g1_i1.p1 TRINITY_DN5456_c0_g1~~TRINITY_DN5456_c0_g1_i1.p1  ORF type:complete len:258 (-),score=25.19 TRINITY_DN5456_c0_g1_i1:88-861(-)
MKVNKLGIVVKAIFIVSLLKLVESASNYCNVDYCGNNFGNRCCDQSGYCTTSSSRCYYYSSRWVETTTTTSYSSCTPSQCTNNCCVNGRCGTVDECKREVNNGGGLLLCCCCCIIPLLIWAIFCRNNTTTMPYRTPVHYGAPGVAVGPSIHLNSYPAGSTYAYPPTGPTYVQPSPVYATYSGSEHSQLPRRLDPNPGLNFGSLPPPGYNNDANLNLGGLPPPGSNRNDLNLGGLPPPSSSNGLDMGGLPPPPGMNNY